MFGDPDYFGGATMLYRYPGTNQLRRLEENASDDNYNFWSFEIKKQGGGFTIMNMTALAI